MEVLVGGADQTATLGSTSEYLDFQKTWARSKWLDCYVGAWGFLHT